MVFSQSFPSGDHMRARKQTNDANGGAVTVVEPPANGQSEEKTAPRESRLPVWEFLADEKRDRDGTASWLYRVWPVIDRKQGEHAICKKKGRFSRDEILRDFGSGTYSVQVNAGKGRQLYLETISFRNPDLPPRVDPLEVVVGDPRNDTYFAIWGRPNSAASITPPEGPRAAGVAVKGDAGEILNTILLA
jgi:hypothetical protein